MKPANRKRSKPTPAPPGDETPFTLFVSAGTSLVAGLIIECFYRPAVPLSYAFQLIPIGIGFGIGVALLEPKIESIRMRKLAVGFITVGMFFWMLTQLTSFLPAVLFVVARRVTRAVILLQRT